MQLSASNRNWSDIMKIRFGASADAFSTKLRALALNIVSPENRIGSDMFLFLSILFLNKEPRTKIKDEGKVNEFLVNE